MINPQRNKSDREWFQMTLMERLAKIQRLLRLYKGYVMQDRQTSTRDASKLLISSVFEKLNCEGSYSIGGTCTDIQPEFWFHFTTSCYGETNLLNLFVRVYLPGRYRVKYVSNRKLLLHDDPRNDNIMSVIIGYGDLKERSFRTKQVDEHVYLNTYEFRHGDIITYCNQSLAIPIGIKNTAPIQHLSYSIRRLLNTRLEGADFTIISNTNEKHPIHSIALEEHSPVVLKKQVCRARDDSQTSLSLDITDHEIRALTEFIYFHNNIVHSSIDFMDIVKLVPKFGLTKLYDWVKDNAQHYICYTNAYEIGKLAVKYEWKDILQVIFECIDDSPEILYTFGQKDDVDRIILKEILHYKYGG